MPGGSPTSRVPSISKLTRVTIVRIPITCSRALVARQVTKRGDRPDRANEFVDFARLAVYGVQSPPYTDEAMGTQATTPRTTEHRGRLMTTLFAAQVCGGTGHSIGMAIGGIMAAGITA